MTDSIEDKEEDPISTCSNCGQLLSDFQAIGILFRLLKGQIKSKDDILCTSCHMYELAKEKSEKINEKIKPIHSKKPKAH